MAVALLHQGTRARLESVTPLGRPRSAYKSDVERHAIEILSQIILKSRSMTPIF